jgi:hypothetical protein
MVLFERGKALAQIGDTRCAAEDLAEAARRFPLEKYKKQALVELARLQTRAAPSEPAVQESLAVHQPTRRELALAHRVFGEKESRAVDYEVAARLLAQALAGSFALSPTVPVALLLQSWNFAYYQEGRRFDLAHFEAIDAALRKHRTTLDGFRERTIWTWQAADRRPTQAVLRTLDASVGRVGAVKAMHLWAPDFFPLWDNPIAEAYGLDLSAPDVQYCTFIDLIRQQLPALEPPEGVAPLKALDEFNYCRFTKGWV